MVPFVIPIVPKQKCLEQCSGIVYICTAQGTVVLWNCATVLLYYAVPFHCYNVKITEFPPGEVKGYGTIVTAGERKQKSLWAVQPLLG